MGHDEHGPAYPEPPKDSVPVLLSCGEYRISREAYEHYGADMLEALNSPPYRCPICRGDSWRYVKCEYPCCPDGRDRGHPHAALRETYDGPAPSKHPVARVLFGCALVIALVMYMMWPRSAPAMDHGFNPNNATVKWMESLPRPNTPGSCCGKGDGYPVEDYWPNPDGSWTAKIGDGSAMKYPDGTTREYIANGTEVIVPRELVNPWEDDLGNPTDVSWLFMTVHAAEVGTIYCLIRHPQGG